MTAAELITSLHERGIKVTVEGDKIRCRASREPLTKRDQKLLRRFKTDLIALLARPPSHSETKQGQGAEGAFARRRCIACGTPQPPNGDSGQMPCRVCRPRPERAGAEAERPALAGHASPSIDRSASVPVSDAWLEEAVRIVIRLRRCASGVSVAHALQDLRDLVALGGPEATRWGAILKEVEHHRRNAVRTADRCAACGTERLAFHPQRPCPACDGWERPEPVRGVALQLLREDVALSVSQRSADAASACAVSA